MCSGGFPFCYLAETQQIQTATESRSPREGKVMSTASQVKNLFPPKHAVYGDYTRIQRVIFDSLVTGGSVGLPAFQAQFVQTGRSRRRRTASDDLASSRGETR